MKIDWKVFTLGLLWGIVLGLLVPEQAFAQQLLPNGQQQFTDVNGAPLAGGSVFFYVPNTTTPKFTYQDPGLTVPNTNPVILNAAGRAIVWGTGTYREIVYDQFGTLIWDQLTSGFTNPSPISGQGFGPQTALASGTTTDLGTISSNNVLVTGNTTITSFGSSASTATPVFLVTFQSGLTLTYNATSMVLPGGRSIQARAGDSALVLYLGVGNWQMVQWRSQYPDPLASGFGAQTALASAGTVDLGTATGNNALVSGTTTITSLGSTASTLEPLFLVQFAGALTLTYNVTSLQTPGQVNIQTAAGDTALAMYLGAGNWQIIQYTQAARVQTIPSLHVNAFTTDGGLSFPVPGSVNISTPIEFICAGPGGGGGSYSGGSGGGGGGGGAGGYADYLVTGFAFGNTITGNVGGIGGAGSTSNGSPGNSGNAATKFTYAGVDFLSCGLGVGGASGSSNDQAGGALGAVSVNFAGAGLTGTLIPTGASQAGTNGRYSGNNIGSGGSGGGCPLGERGAGGNAKDSSASTGQSATGYCAGGAGGASGINSQDTGGGGAPGAAIIRGFY